MGRAWMPLYVGDCLRDTRTNHNQRSISSSSFPSDSSPENSVAPGSPENRKPANHKPANRWSRQELDALFARRTVAGAVDAIAKKSNPETGE
jgi:hypothetical protein